MRPNWTIVPYKHMRTDQTISFYLTSYHYHSTDIAMHHAQPYDWLIIEKWNKCWKKIIYR